MSKKLRTPIIKPRKQGGTFYTFGSALEDVGLNINELQNKVVLSHYALIDIPEFNIKNISGDVNKGDYTFAENFQNYALNMETVLRNRDNYNFANSYTISEQVFWKFVKKYCINRTTGESCLKLKQVSSTYNTYYEETVSNTFIKAVGLISAGAQRTDSYGIYNETFVQVPSSFGTTPAYFKVVDDSNYTACTAHGGNEQGSTKIIEYITSDEYNSSMILNTGISAKAIGDNNSYPVSYNVSSVSEQPTEHIKLVLDINEINKLRETNGVSFDDLAIAGNPYMFNAALIYYTIYNSYGTALATNLYGILIFDNAAQVESTYYKFKDIDKKKTTATANGTSYSFRLNIKATSTYSGDINVNDNSTPSYEMSEDFTDVIRNLADAVDILRRNAGIISKIASDNQSIKALVSNLMSSINNQGSGSSGSGGGGGTSSAVIIDYDNLEYSKVNSEINAGHIVLCRCTKNSYVYYANMSMFDYINSVYYFTAIGRESDRSTVITISIDSNDNKNMIGPKLIAYNDEVVHNTGNEYVNGEKTFNDTYSIIFKEND